MNVLSNSCNENNNLPNNLLAEKNILSELLLSQVKTNVIFTRLLPEMFYSKEYRAVYTVAYSLYQEGITININTICDRLGNEKLFTDTDNISFLLDIVNGVLPFGDIETYIVLLVDKYLRRKLIITSNSISELAKNSSFTLENVFDEAETRLLNITQKKPNIGLIPASEILLEAFIDLENRAEKGGLLGIPSGFFDLDNITQGLQKSDLIIIAGRPSMGKTAFALNIARNVAEFQDYPVAIFSLEMSRQQIVYRFLSGESQVTNSKLRSGSISNIEWKSLSQSINILSELKIYVDDTPNISVRDIKSKIERLKSKNKEIGLIVIDYLQLLNDVNNSESRVNELSRITRSLKILAREINVPVIVLSQLSRNVESRTNKRPILSDLRESGCIAPDSSLYLSQINKNISVSSLLSLSYNNILSLSNASNYKLQSKHSLKKRVFITGVKLLYNLDLYNGLNLKLTYNHKIFTNMGWIRLSNLLFYQLICILDISNFRKFSIFTFSNSKRINPGISFIGFSHIWLLGKNTVYDLWVPGFANFIINKCIIHNSIEQDADIVLMLYRDDYYEDLKTDDSITDVIIAKHRNGPIGTINISFNPKTASFENLIV